MTTTIVIGEQTKPVQLQKIIFERVLESDFACIKTNIKPDSYAYIELICLEYNGEKDLMFAYDNPDDRGGGVLYIGKWNDGIV